MTDDTDTANGDRKSDDEFFDIACKETDEKLKELSETFPLIDTEFYKSIYDIADKAIEYMICNVNRNGDEIKKVIRKYRQKYLESEEHGEAILGIMFTVYRKENDKAMKKCCKDEFNEKGEEVWRKLVKKEYPKFDTAKSEVDNLFKTCFVTFKDRGLIAIQFLYKKSQLFYDKLNALGHDLKFSDLEAKLQRVNNDNIQNQIKVYRMTHSIDRLQKKAESLTREKQMLEERFRQERERWEQHTETLEREKKDNERKMEDLSNLLEIYKKKMPTKVSRDEPQLESGQHTANNTQHIVGAQNVYQGVTRIEQTFNQGSVSFSPMAQQSGLQLQRNENVEDGCRLS